MEKSFLLCISNALRKKHAGAMQISSRGKKEKRSDNNTLFSTAMNNFHGQKRISQVNAHNRAVKVESLDLRYGVCPVRLPWEKKYRAPISVFLGWTWRYGTFFPRGNSYCTFYQEMTTDHAFPVPEKPEKIFQHTPIQRFRRYP